MDNKVKFALIREFSNPICIRYEMGGKDSRSS